ncbi:MAG: septation protein SepH [Aeromicrobium erythreum]
MRDIGPDRVTPDGRLLVLRDDDTGETFGAEVEAVRGLIEAADRVRRASRTESSMDTPTLTPREIQTRIRRGESPDEVAAAAGVEPAAIAGFAGPVLAEREYMSEQARRTTIRRRHVGGPGLQLGAAVDERLAADGISPDDAQWDAWRREDGRWTVTVTRAGAPDPATFVYDTKGRYVLPADEVAHDLVGDVALPEQADMAIADAVRRQPAEPETLTVEVAADAADDAVDQPRPEATDAAVASLLDEHHAPVSSLAEARDRRALEQQALAAQQQPEPAAPEQDSLDDLFSQAEQQDADVAVPDTVAPRKKKNERRRVPSWDEIMFGGRDD